MSKLVKQSFFLLTKLRMRYFLLDDYWKNIVRLEANIRSNPLMDGYHKKIEILAVLKTAYLQNLRIFYECGMIKLIEENRQVEEEEMTLVCQTVFEAEPKAQ